MNQELSYYQNDTEGKPNGIINLADALISNITLIRERDHSFSIQTAPPNGKTFFLSCNSIEESNEWREAIIEASEKHKIHMAQNSFQNKTAIIPKYGTTDRTSMLIAQPKQEVFDENEIFNEDASIFEATKFKRHTIGAGGSRNQNLGQSQNTFYGNTLSPDHPFKLSKIQGSPRPYTTGSETSPLTDTPEEHESFNKTRALAKKKSNLKSLRKVGKADTGIMTQEQITFLNQIQKMVKEDTGQAVSSDHWDTVTMQNGIQIQALNPQYSRIVTDKKQLKSYIKSLVGIFTIFYIIKSYIFEIDYFYFGLLVQFLNFKKLKNIFSLQKKFTYLKAKTLVRGDPELLGQEILKGYIDQSQQSFDFMRVQSREITRDDDKHLVTVEETLDLPSDYIAKQFLERRQMKVLNQWCTDEAGCFYVLRKSIQQSGQNSRYINNVQEAFVCVPIDSASEKCLVYFFSDFNYGNQGPKIIMNNVFQDQLKVERMSILTAFVQYSKYESEKQMKEIYQVTKEVEQKIVIDQVDDNIFNQPLKLQDLEDRINTVNSISSHQGEVFNGKNKGNSNNYKTNNKEAGGQQVKIYKENPKNIIVKSGQRLTISDRFPGYFRLENGALWCHNQDELSSQSGIIMDLLQRAGKTLMEGKGIVSISLPVRIFEKRSTIERICDLWCTGPIYLKRAAIEHDPVERMKQVITFVISGMHQVAIQRKPFNPIIGETYQGYWPDGSKVFVEHISHHPPISSFLVENIDSLYTFEGSYEYTARVTELGNSVTGRQVGINRVRFPDGNCVEWEYPTMKITGLMFGKRTIQWLGSFEFVDRKNQLKANLSFSKEGGFFSRSSLPIDCIEGQILKQGQPVSTVEGSWLEFLRFDNKLYWEIETCDTVRPVAVEKCLPSDCRYREDSLAFATGDLDKAQIEKERLEELQRADRRLRENANKKQKNNNF